MNIQFNDLTAAEVQQLREVVDALPVGPFATLIVKLSRALPMTSDFSRPRDEHALNMMLQNLGMATRQ